MILKILKPFHFDMDYPFVFIRFYFHNLFPPFTEPGRVFPGKQKYPPRPDSCLNLTRTGTRSGISALRQIDKSIEESAYDMGADSFKVFMTVTLPLIKDSFLSGLVTAFVRSITAISAIILLVTPQFLLITVQINEFAEKGSYSLACAFATILIIITYGAVLLMNLFTKYFGTSRKIKED